MKFPTWTEFVEKTSKFEKTFQSKIEEFKENHPLLDKFIQKSLPTLPPPFNIIAENIYNSFEGSSEEKTTEVLNYFTYLKNQGEKHYYQVTIRLDEVINKLDDLKKLTAKEETLSEIQETLISSGALLERKLDKLNEDLSEIKNNVKNIENTTNVIEQISKNTEIRTERIEKKSDKVLDSNFQISAKLDLVLDRMNFQAVSINEQSYNIPKITEENKIETDKLLQEFKESITSLKDTKDIPKDTITEILTKAVNYSYFTGNLQDSETLNTQLLKLEPSNEIANQNKLSFKDMGHGNPWIKITDVQVTKQKNKDFTVSLKADVDGLEKKKLNV